VDGSVIALLCRTSDREASAAQGARALALEVGRRLGIEARLVGSPGAPRALRYDEDLRESRGCLLEAGGQLEDALTAGRHPLLFAADCSICVTTLPVLARDRPDAWVLWLDAHGDFNTPETTTSGFLGGMCLAGACGLWDTGFGAGLDPTRVVMCGVRDIEAGERVLLDTHGVGLVEQPSDLAGVLRGRPVFVHLDLDVLDPGVMDFQFPVAGGFSAAGLHSLLGEVAAAADVIGAEITSFTAPQRAEDTAMLIEALLPVAVGS